MSVFTTLSIRTEEGWRSDTKKMARGESWQNSRLSRGLLMSFLTLQTKQDYCAWAKLSASPSTEKRERERKKSEEKNVPQNMTLNILMSASAQ